ncbi:MAG: adenylosuccinate lyase [Methanomassiliicoccales archaeon]|nr:adenylosuccinate lyase [Methanomassiliicoccales archaeon]
MVVCPLDFRYGREEMKAILSEESRLRAQLKVEGALALALAKVGDIPLKDAKAIAKVCHSKLVTLERVKRIEADTKHDVMAMVQAITEKSGPAGRYVHLGATSNDIVDTAMALEIKRAMALIERDLTQFTFTLASLAERHKNTIMVARTHGQFAIPTTFGFKIAGYVAEMLRFQERLKEVRKRACVGKMSGAVGTGAALGRNFLKVQDDVMKQLGLGVEEVATQIVCRDRYAELACLLALIASACERYATEVRNLQRSEINEVAEGFDREKQVGSSTMAQKRNPMLSENVCGLARIARGFAIPAIEDMNLWHERDLTNSSAERFILPHLFVLTDDILIKMDEVFSGLEVHEGKMRENIESANGLIMAEAVMIAMVGKGLGRQDAHAIVRKASLKAEMEGAHLMDVLLVDKKVAKLFMRAELEEVMDPASYLGKAPEMTMKVVRRVRSSLKTK